MDNKLRKIIREMIMAEAYEHTDDEIVTFENIDLEHEFNKMNKLVFNGELAMVDLNWSTSKVRHGHVSYRRRYDGTVERIHGLFLSKFFKIPYSKFKDTLAHEMIHVKNLQDDIRLNRRSAKGGHGYDFIAEMNRINAMNLGFKVDVTETNKFDVADDVKGKNVYFVILKLDGQKSGDFIAVMIPKAFAERKETIERIFNNLIKARKYNSVTLEYYQSNSPKLMAYTVQRNFARSVSYTPIKQEEIPGLKSLGTFMEKVELGEKTASDQTNKEKEKRELSGFYSQPTAKNTLTKVEPPKKTEVPKELAPTSERTKELNKKILAMFKASNDKWQKEALFNILKSYNEKTRESLIDAYNQRFGRLGFI
jgi:hypothetical protein